MSIFYIKQGKHAMLGIRLITIIILQFFLCASINLGQETLRCNVSTVKGVQLHLLSVRSQLSDLTKQGAAETQTMTKIAQQAKQENNNDLNKGKSPQRLVSTSNPKKKNRFNFPIKFNFLNLVLGIVMPALVGASLGVVFWFAFEFLWLCILVALVSCVLVGVVYWVVINTMKQERNTIKEKLFSLLRRENAVQTRLGQVELKEDSLGKKLEKQEIQKQEEQINLQGELGMLKELLGKLESKLKLDKEEKIQDMDVIKKEVETVKIEKRKMLDDYNKKIQNLEQKLTQKSVDLNQIRNEIRGNKQEMQQVLKDNEEQFRKQQKLLENKKPYTVIKQPQNNGLGEIEQKLKKQEQELNRLLNGVGGQGRNPQDAKALKQLQKRIKRYRKDYRQAIKRLGAWRDDMRQNRLPNYVNQNEFEQRLDREMQRIEQVHVQPVRNQNIALQGRIATLERDVQALRGAGGGGVNNLLVRIPILKQKITLDQVKKFVEDAANDANITIPTKVQNQKAISSNDETNLYFDVCVKEIFDKNDLGRKTFAKDLRFEQGQHGLKQGDVYKQKKQNEVFKDVGFIDPATGGEKIGRVSSADRWVEIKGIEKFVQDEEDIAMFAEDLGVLLDIANADAYRQGEFEKFRGLFEFVYENKDYLDQVPEGSDIIRYLQELWHKTEGKEGIKPEDAKAYNDSLDYLVAA